VAKTYDAVLLGIELNPKQRVVLASDYKALKARNDASMELRPYSQDRAALEAAEARIIELEAMLRDKRCTSESMSWLDWRDRVLTVPDAGAERG
jgi:hypothetical protein